MNINLHIERLVLDGLPVAINEAAQVRAAVEAELVTRLAQGDLLSPTNGFVARLTARSIQLERTANPGRIGAQIAAVVYASMAPAASRPVLPLSPQTLSEPV